MELSVIIPVYNEKDKINEQIKHVKSVFKDIEYEIIVVDGHPENTTISCVTDEDIIKLSSEKGRGTQLKYGSLEACGKILLFLHADTLLPEKAFELIKNSLIDPYQCGAFDLGIDSKETIFRVLETLSSLRSRLTGIPYGDQAHFFEKEFYALLGGYSPIPLMEDVDIMRRVKRSKRKPVIIKTKVMTSARRWLRKGVLKTTVDNWKTLLKYYLGTSPEELVKSYYNEEEKMGAEDFYTKLSKNYNDVFPFVQSTFEFLTKYIDKEKPVLDVGCGTGTYLNRLAEDGFDAKGIEYVDMMASQSPHSKIGDMHKLSEYYDEKFGTIYCIGNTLVHADGLAGINKVFSEINKSLETGGRLIIQILNYDRILAKRIPCLAPIETDKLTFERLYEYEGDSIIFKGIIHENGEKTESSVKLYPVISNELKKAASDNGFEIEHVFGDFQESDFDIETSFSKVVIMKKI